MRRLIQLMSCFAVGYIAYELIQRMKPSFASSNRAGSRPETSHPGEVTMTGPGEGRRVRTEDSDGAAITHVVGRGVI